jgi:uncharacterized protein YkwD
MKTRTLAFIAVAFALLTLLVAAGPAAQSARAVNACEAWGNLQSPTTAQAREAILCLLNRERNSRGLRDLKVSTKLQAAAQKHNDYMQKKRCFDHQCPGEKSLTGRLESIGWITRGLNAWAYGENIAWGSGRLGSPASIVRSWMNSSGHKANILSNKFDEIGVGYTAGTITNPNAVGGIYTTDFGWKTG